MCENKGGFSPLFSPDSDDRLSLNSHRFVILYISCDTQSVGLGQYCLSKVSNKPCWGMLDVIRARHTPWLMPRSPCWWSLGLLVNAALPKMHTSLNNTRSVSMVNMHKFTTTLQCCSIVSAISQKGLYSSWCDMTIYKEHVMVAHTVQLNGFKW